MGGLSITDVSLARLIYEQTKLVSKGSALTPAEKRQFRTRAKKINLLLRRQRREGQRAPRSMPI